MTRQSAKAVVSTIGIDIGKNTFHLVGMDASGIAMCRIAAAVARQLESPFG